MKDEGRIKKSSLASGWWRKSERVLLHGASRSSRQVSDASSITKNGGWGQI
jgi:hypothetical protein